MLPRLATAIAACGLITHVAAAQQTAAGDTARATITASRRAAPIKLDGRLDEGAWSAALTATEFVQQQPVEGKPAESRTEVRVLFDDDAVYVGARMFDSDPGSIARQLVRRDDSGQADWFAVGFDPRLDRRTAYVFQISAANVQSDSYAFNDSDLDRAWDAVWESAVQTDSLGWTAELRIPLSQIRYEATAGRQTWGVNFARRRVRNNEESHFALMSRLRQGMVSQFGTMTGIEITQSPRRAELRPYALLGAATEPADSRNSFSTGSSTIRRAGLDARYGFGPSFTLDATVNPDFGQVEADPAVINLSAFETFFEERRLFFVQDAQIFNFRLSGMTNRLFYPRRIGRQPTGRAPAGAEYSDVPDAGTIRAAAKLTGRTARGLSVGALTALTGAARGRASFPDSGGIREFVAEPQTWHGVARARQDFAGGASTVGVIATALRRGLPRDGSFDYLPLTALSTGVDWEHQWGDRTYALSGYAAASHVRGDSLAVIRIQRASNHYFQRPDALRLRVDSSARAMSGLDWRMTLEKRRGAHWTGSVWAAQVTPGFEINDLGFSNRQEVLDAGARVGYREIRPGRLFRSYRASLFTFNNWSHEVLENLWSARSWGESQVGAVVGLNAGATLLNYWDVGTRLFLRPETVDRTATRGGPLTIQPRAAELGVEVSSDARKPVSFSAGAELERRTLGAGGNNEIRVEVAFRPSPRIEAAIAPAWQQGRIGAQYVAATRVLPYASTFGTRYLFADVERKELSVETRVNVTFSPSLTLQMFAQPLISAGDHVTYKQLSAPRTFAFGQFAEGSYVPGSPARCAGGRVCVSPARTRLVDFDGDGTVDYTFTDRDFNVRSLTGNAVIRWEYRPGSALFVVWQREQEDETATGQFRLSRDVRALAGAPARNVFMVKASYWLGF